MKFEHQSFQQQCVNNIVSVLMDFDFENNSFSNLQKNISSLKVPIKDIEDNKLKIDILMETGTGKTFVYLKTIFEINKKFGLNKFIIFVPRKAIRQQVLQNIALTKEFFYSDDKYKKYLETYSYDGNISSINGFLRNKGELSVLVLTNSSIDKKYISKLRRGTELYGMSGSVFNEIKKLKPIIIIDEPHLLKGEQFTKAFNEFDSLCIRFGATFPKEQEHKISNVAYVLDSISAFKEALVKKIRVNAVFSNSDTLHLSSINPKEKNVRFEYFKDDFLHEKLMSANEDIGAKTGLSQYKGISIVKISKNKLYLSNKTEMEPRSSFLLNDEQIESLIDKTIRLHFEKEERLFLKGIKELSLFFIPNTADFRGENPRIRNIFERKYKEIRKEIYPLIKNEKYREFLDKDFKDGKLTVCEGYFAGDKGGEDAEKEAIDLILKDKEALLSFDTPLRFIFSVWALQEGWDNPNIFNLCKLSNAQSSIARRQQIGRGLRLCVNQRGQRITLERAENEDAFYEINVLDAVVSSYEKDFIEEIQKEINENSFALCAEYITFADLEKLGFNQNESMQTIFALKDNSAVEFIENKNGYLKNPNFETFIKNNRDKFSFLSDDLYKKLLDASDEKLKSGRYIKDGNKKIKVNLRKDKIDDFKQMWETINKKARIVYKDLSEDRLIEIIAKEFNASNIPPLLTRVEIKEFDPKSNSIKSKKIESLSSSDFFKSSDFDEFINAFRNKYPLNFLLKLFNKLEVSKIKDNPKEAFEILDTAIKERIHEKVTEKIEYSFSPEVKITTLQEDSGLYKTSIESGILGHKYDAALQAKDTYLYDKVVYDSNIERKIITDDFDSVNDCKVTVFAKLPSISIPTPYKKYNPDFAYLVEKSGGKKLFLIAEAKGYDKEKDIPPDEVKKINYAEKFFEALKDYVCRDCPEIEIAFVKRINKTSLADILKSLNAKEKR